MREIKLFLIILITLNISSSVLYLTNFVRSKKYGGSVKFQLKKLKPIYFAIFYNSLILVNLYFALFILNNRDISSIIIISALALLLIALFGLVAPVFNIYDGGIYVNRYFLQWTSIRSFEFTDNDGKDRLKILTYLSNYPMQIDLEQDIKIEVEKYLKKKIKKTGTSWS